ncbi:TetR family transcriptional regulator [Sciscionella sediminilitoris]|uniref:TetR family transcriptional regulator n=1 Tax=Sciscionella sediminilitoris TaxID=1445613 RepID=UPI0004DF1731|nr:TetR family transcriptional regulator [Sciscionella sp. SE31]
MARWEPNPRDRLVHTALELFSEQGYEKTTVVEIAERAGLTKSTFFRHFPDKREVLFTGQDELVELLKRGIAESPEPVVVLDAVAAALNRVAEAFTEDRRAYGPQRRAVLADNAELRERDALKEAVLSTVMRDALCERGLPEFTARLAGELGLFALRRAYEQWLEPEGDRPFAAVVADAVGEVRAGLADLGT